MKNLKEPSSDINLLSAVLTRRKPWNRPNLPVYSVSSRHLDAANMNIITYATAVSMKPKRYLCAIYKGTKTLENVTATQHFILQLLASHQYPLVKLLGQQSGKKIDKIKKIGAKALIQWNGFEVLKDALALMEMKVIHSFDGGDHICFLCDVVAAKNSNNGEGLNLEILRQKKIIRA